ncbi:peptidylprolyl isomerase [Patescibacteria group bacterium]|nr:peptidylprolyl isomerase [Patescibacteria group bacterium]
MVWYRDVVEIAAVLEQSNREGIFSDPWDHALQIAIERKHTKHLVRELDSFVGQAEVASYPIDEEDLTDFLQDVGWTVDDYRHYIVQPLLLSQKAEKAVYASDLYQRNARNRIEMIQEKIELGVSFTDLAKQHSEDLSASFGGDIGYVTADELDQGLESIFDLEAGKISDILEGPTYFAIVYVYDLVEIDEEEVQAGIQIITVNKDGLAEALVDYSADKKVVFFVR